MTTVLVPESSTKFYCKNCDYSTSRHSQYVRHLSTAKHIETTKRLQNTTDLVHDYTCDKCDRVYKHHSSLWKHKKTCIKTNEQTNEQTDINSIDANMIIQILKQNDEFKSMLLEQNNKLIEVCKNNNTNITNNVNSHNKAFNLNVFLNEECKDAMSITDFVNSIKLQLSDLEAVGKLGFVNGISNIIIKNLRALDVHMRPIHCTDTKRETMYVKGQDAWEKEGDDNKQLRLAIKRVAKNNFCCLELFKEKHPDCINWDSKHGDHYLKLRIEALGGRGNEDRDNENKIIRKIARETTIDKHMND